MNLHTNILLSVLIVVIGSAVAVAAWDPGDSHKMHYPQLPDPTGWDVLQTRTCIPNAYALADDWQCAETGPVSDIHYWYSRNGYNGISPPPFTLPLTVRIRADIPAGESPTGYSIPGDILWERDFSEHGTEYEFRYYGSGLQGWYDPVDAIVLPDDHQSYFQLNIPDISDPFIQQAGEIYWLELLQPYCSPGLGWKTSQDHFNDNAVYWWNGGYHRLTDPVSGDRLDFAFVITPEPATLCLLAFGGLAVLRWKR